jgi:predicted TIM-barrel fold metal-dependent hydrolase
MIIDCHHHLWSEPDYADRLAETCERLDIGRVCLMALPDYYGPASGNAAVAAACARYPDLFVGFAYVDLGRDDVGRVNWALDQGFRGLKLINPRLPYDDDALFPIYERAAALGVVCLFHLGIVARDDSQRPDFPVRCHYMRPIHLDTIARLFPDLTVIGAHLGNPWYAEAGMACRWNANLYFDLTGSTLKKKSPEELDRLLWWRPDSRYRDAQGRHAWQKILFGSDTSWQEIEEVLGDYRRCMDELHISNEIQRQVLGDTAGRLLGLSA